MLDIKVAENQSMTEIKSQMITEAVAAGGTPVGKRTSLHECFTYDHTLKHLMLWYNKGKTTKMISREYSPKDTDFIQPQWYRRGSIGIHSEY